MRFHQSTEDHLPGAPVLTIHGLTFGYGQRRLLDQVDLEVRPGSSVAVTGRSGSGKSSLLSCILGLARPDSGEIRVDGERVQAGRGNRTTRLRREKVGMIFQSGELLSELSASENVVVAGLLAGQPVAEAKHRAATLLGDLGVPDGKRSISEFSGGEQQRVAVARALMNRPRLLLADEPTGSLDPETRDQVIESLFRLPADYDCALVVVTHDPIVAQQAGRRFRLDQGVLSPADGLSAGGQALAAQSAPAGGV